MGKKSSNTLTTEKNTSRNNFNNCKMLNDNIYSRILDYDSTELVDSFIFELFLRVKGFRNIYDECYTTVEKIKNRPKLFNYQSKCYQNLIKKYQTSFQKYNYNIRDILVYIFVSIANTHKIKFNKNSKLQYIKSNPLLLEVIQNDESEILEDLGAMQYIFKYSNNLSLYKWKLQIPQNVKYKQKSINITINLHKNPKDQATELHKIKQLIKEEESNIIINPTIEEIEHFCNKVNQEGLLLHLYLYDCYKNNVSTKHIHEHTNKYLEACKIKIDKSIETRLNLVKDKRTIKSNIEIIEDFLKKLMT